MSSILLKVPESLCFFLDMMSFSSRCLSLNITRNKICKDCYKYFLTCLALQDRCQPPRKLMKNCFSIFVDGNELRLNWFCGKPTHLNAAHIILQNLSADILISHMDSDLIFYVFLDNNIYFI